MKFSFQHGRYYIFPFIIMLFAFMVLHATIEYSNGNSRNSILAFFVWGGIALLRLFLGPKITTGVFVSLPEKVMDVEFSFPHNNKRISLNGFSHADAKVIPGKFASVELKIFFTGRSVEVLVFKPEGGDGFLELPKERVPDEVIRLRNFINSNF